MSEALITKILTETSVSRLHAYLKNKTPESLAAFYNLDPLEQINPAVHSLGYLYILKARILHQAKTDSAESIVQKIALFLQMFDAKQIKAVPAEFPNLVSDFAEVCDSILKTPAIALPSLKAAVHRYGKSPTHLTSIHHIYVRQCLLSKRYDEALEMLEIPIDDLDLDVLSIQCTFLTGQTEFAYHYYLLYFYYGSMVYIALKQYRKAYDFTKLVITAPGSACSAIQLEAYKKFILLSIILNGKMSSIPATVSQAAARAFKYLSRSYEELAQALKRDENVDECLRTHENVYAEDKNLGLIAQVLERRAMRRIAALKEAYIAISLEDVAKKVCGTKSPNSLQEDIQRVESLIVRMIDEGHLSASISDSPPIVTFYDKQEIPTRHQLDAIVSSISNINSKIKALDREVGMSKAYISRCMTKPNQGRLSPVDGEPDIRWSVREGEPGKKQGRPGGKSGSIDRGATKLPLMLNDKMED